MSSEDAKIQDETVAASQVISTTGNPEETSAAETIDVAPLEDLKKLFSRVKDSMLRSSTSVEALNEASNIISSLNAQILSQASPMSEEQSKFFYSEFFKEICQRAANCEIKNVASQEAVTELIRRLVDLLAGELKMETSTWPVLAQQMKHIFDCDSKFYSHLQTGSAGSGTGTTSSTQVQYSSGDKDAQVDFNDDEIAWRLSLEVGKTIDVLKRDVRKGCEMWTKAEIVAVTGMVSDISTKRLKIAYYGDISLTEAELKADSTQLAPYGTLAAGQSWRDEIQKFDVIDALDSDGVWQTATVIWKDNRGPADELKMPMLKVGFRLYGPDGDKKDYEGTYTGEDKDEYIGIWSVRIQRQHSQTMLVNLPGNSVAIAPDVLASLRANLPTGMPTISTWDKQVKQDEKDMEQITEDGQVIVAVERDSQTCNLLVELLNRFAEGSGFASILQALAKQDTSLQGVNDLCALVSNCGPLYHKTFVDAYMERLKDAVEAKLGGADEQLLRPTKFKTIEDTVEMVWLKLMKRKAPETEIQIGKYQLLTKLGILFLKQKFMQKRIDGAIAIDMVCKRALQQGTSKVKETLKKSDDASGVVPALVKTLQEADIIDLFFSRTNIHDQLVMRAEGVLGLFLNQEVLSEDQLNMIWTNAGEDAIYRNLISSLSNLASKVKPLQLTSIIERVVQTPKNKIKSDEIELVMSLCFENSYDSDEAPVVKINQARVLEFYWEFLTDASADQYLTKVIANKAIFNFMDILKQNSEELIESYFGKMQELMLSGTCPFMGIKIGHRYFKEIKVSARDKLPIFADKLEEKFQLMQLIIEELNKYSAMVTEKVRQEMAQAEAQEKTFDDSKLHEKVYAGVFNHQDQITERIEFLTVFAQECATKLSKDQLAQLWNVLVENNLIKFDKRQLFSMLKNFVDVALAAEDNKVIDVEDLCSFYRECIATGLSDFTNLEVEGFVCIQSFFVLNNSRENRIKILDDYLVPAKKGILKTSATGSSKVTSISSDGGAKQQQLDFAPKTTQITTTGTGSGPDTVVETGNTAITGGVGTEVKPKTTTTAATTKPKDGKINLMAIVPPSEIAGLAGLWKIAQQAVDTKVSDAVVALLIQLHTHLDPDLQPRISEFEDMFIKSCVDAIQDNLAMIEARTPEEKEAVAKAISLIDKKKLLCWEKRISLSMRCLQRLIQNSEKEGTFGLTSHRSFAQGTLIADIRVTNEFNFAPNGGYQKTFTMKLKSNMTVQQVKKLICKELAFKKVDKIQEIPPHPCAIKLTLNRFCDRPIEDKENGMLMRELLLKEGDKITVSPRGNNELLQMSLLDPETSKLTVRAKEAVRHLFEKYAIATPEVPDLLFLGSDQVKELIEGVSDKASLKPSAILAYNSNEDLTKLLFADFQSYYEQMATEKPDLVRENLSSIGLRSDMRVIPQPGDADDILNLRKSHQEMPRYKIANEQRTFQLLLACLDLDADTRRDAQELILQACTNEKIQREVLEVSPRMFEWDPAAQRDGAKEAVYTLAMVEQILYNSDATEEDPASQSNASTDEARAEENELRNTWVPRFLAAGGLDKATQMLETVLQQLSEGRKHNMPNDQSAKLKEVLSCTIKIVKVFVTATVCSSKNDANADLFSIKQTSSALSKRLQQGGINLICINKYLRRADKEEEDLEAKLEKGCINKAATTSFFGAPLAPKKSLAKPANSQSPSKQKTALDDGTLKTEDITEDLLFGNDICVGDGAYGPEPPTGRHQVSEEREQELQQPSLARQVSKEGGDEGDNARIHFFEVTSRYRQIAQQITEAMNNAEFNLSLDYHRLADFCLEAAATFMFSTDKDLTFEKALIEEAFNVYCACKISSGGPLAWERKAVNIEEGTRVRGMSDLIREGLTCSMPAVRRYWFQSLSLACEQLSSQLSGEKRREPYQVVIHEIVRHLNSAQESDLFRLSEEIYEVLGDCCLSTYDIERQLKHQGIGYEPTQDSYKDVVQALISILKRHDSCNGNDGIEDVTQARTLESLLLALADVFSFFNKCETYDAVQKVLQEEQLIEYIFYEVIFFVPGKTQYAHRNKAKRAETRKAAYQLLFKVIKFLRPADMVVFIRDLFQPMIEAVPRPVSWSHQPSEKVRRAADQVGIRNLGNVCYMISMLQQFFMIPAFRYSLLKVLDNSPEKLEEWKERQIDDNMLRQLQMLFGQLEKTERAFVDPTEFCFTFKQPNGQPTNTGEQRDAQEFVNEFFDKLEGLLKDSPQKYLLEDIFQGSLVSQKKCESCNHVTRSVEPFYTQTLYVENRVDVAESLQKQVEGDIIQDFRCESCNELVNLRKSQVMAKLPNVLILHLQRIVFDFNTYLNTKLTNRFEFPMILDLAKYSARDNITLSEEEKKDPANKEFLEMLEYDDDEFVYRLVGVCIHRGEANSGHYWSLIHMKRGSQEPDPVAEEAKWSDLNNNWREFNDESVNFFLSRNVVEHGYGGYMTDQEMKIFTQSGGGGWSKSAYMLVYEKKLKSELREVSKEEGKDEEIVRKVNFNGVEPEIPSWIDEAVRKDNRAHAADNQVFQPIFFTFAAQILRHCTAELLDQEDEYSPEEKPAFKSLQKHILETGHKLTFDLLSHYKDNESIKSICSSIRSVFSWSDPNDSFGRDEDTSLLLKFVKELLHADKCEYIFKIMYDSTASREVRDQVGRTVARVLVKALKIIGVCRKDDRRELPLVAELTQVVKEVMQTIIGILPSRTFQQKWSKLDDYFEMLNDIGHDEAIHAEFLLCDMKQDDSDDIVTILCDFMLQQKSPKACNEPDPRVEMGGSQYKPKFSSLVSLTSHLVRCQWTKHSQENCPTFAKSPQKDKNAAPQNMLDFKIELPDMALEYFTNSDLFELIMSCDYGVLDYAKALAHVCFGNEQLSKRICKMARECCYEGSHPNYLIVLCQLLKLDDQDQVTGEALKPKRLEWVFGTPQPRHTVAADGRVKVGLENLDFDINGEAYSYITALCDSEDDSVSVLKLLLKSYDVYQMSADQAEITDLTVKQSSTKAANAGIQESSVTDQLRAQGMGEDQIQQMVGIAASEGQEPHRERSKSDGAANQAKVAKGVNVSQYLNLDSLEAFMKIVAQDEQSMAFFGKMPGFTYQYGRYTDWIGQYLDAISAKDAADSKVLNKDQKAGLRAIKTLYARYENFLHMGNAIEDNATDGPSGDVQMIDTGAVADPIAMPVPYMLLKTESEAAVDLSVESNGLQLTAAALKCMYVDSRPDTATNLAVKQSFLSRFGSNKPTVKASQDAAVPDSSSTQAQAGGNGADEQGNTATDGKFTEPATPDDLKIDLDDPAQQYACQELLTDFNFSWVFEMDEADKLQALENICKEQFYGHVKDYYKQNQTQIIPVGVVAPASEESQAQVAQPSEEEKGEAVADPFSVWQGDTVKTCDDLVYVLRLSNATGDHMKYKINFKDGIPDSPANLVWPTQGLLGSIAPNQTDVIVALLAKATPNDAEEGLLSEIQKLQVTLEGQTDQSKVGNNDGAGGEPAAHADGNQGKNESKQDVSIGFGLQSEKSCDACTMLNPIAATECFICGTKFQN